jgi:O-antigen/teichoic acid export membrane protein
MLPLRKIFNNFAWLFSDRILKMAISLFVGIWIVRYFGPEYFGKFNYVTAWLTLMAAMVPLGTESILVVELVKNSENKDSILASSFFLYLVTGIFFTLTSIGLVLYNKQNDIEIFYLVMILSIPYFVRSLTVPRYYFESILLVKRIVIIENFYLIIFTFLKIFFLYKSFPFLFFIWSFAIEGILVSVSIFIYYISKISSISIRNYSWMRMKKLIQTSLPLFLSSLAIVIYMKVDQIMIGNMIGDKELGIYSVAVRLSELWYFVPMAVSSSFYPHLIQLYESDKDRYWKELQRLHTVLFSIALLVAILVQIAAEWGILLLYGNDFILSASVLKIHIWSGLFVFLGVAGSNHFIISSIQKFSLYKSLVGLAANLALNFLMIPIYGIFGAAIATLISQFLASSLFYIFYSETRKLLKLQLKCLNFWFYWKYLNLV